MRSAEEPIGAELFLEVNRASFPGLVKVSSGLEDISPLLQFLFHLVLTEKVISRKGFAQSKVMLDEVSVETNVDFKTFSKLLLDDLDSSVALEQASDHDRELRRDRLSFFHGVSCIHDSAISSFVPDSLPDHSSGGGVNSGSGLINEDDTRVSNHCHGATKLSLVAST